MDRFALFLLALLVYLVIMAYAFLPTRVPARVRHARSRHGAHPEGLDPISVRRLAVSTATLLIGGGCMIGGIVLLLRGAANTPLWTANAPGTTEPLNTIVPGLLLFVTGLLIVFLTRYKVVGPPGPPRSPRRKSTGRTGHQTS